MEYTVAKIRDKIRLFEKTGIPMTTCFLTPAEVGEALPVLRGVDYTLSGGYEEAERRIFVVGEKEADVTQYLSVIRVESKGQTLTHRSVLGSILGLGIKREMIGDILIHDKNADVFVLTEMKTYLLTQFHQVGKEPVNVKEITFSEVFLLEVPKKAMTMSVASLRVDALMSVAFAIAREKSCQLIAQEKVLINFMPCTNQSKTVHAGDLISVRGYGRLKLLEVLRRN